MQTLEKTIRLYLYCSQWYDGMGDRKYRVACRLYNRIRRHYYKAFGMQNGWFNLRADSQYKAWEWVYGVDGTKGL